MSARTCFSVLLVLQIVVSFLPGTSTGRPFPSSHGIGIDQLSGQSPRVLVGSNHGFQMESKQTDIKGKEEVVGVGEGEVNEEEVYSKGLRNIGSSPPSCNHKCYGCTPCEAIQVPANNHFGVNYANYEPEGWKCKCGPTFFSP